MRRSRRMAGAGIVLAAAAAGVAVARASRPRALEPKPLPAAPAPLPAPVERPVRGAGHRARTGIAVLVAAVALAVAGQVVARILPGNDVSRPYLVPAAAPAASPAATRPAPARTFHWAPSHAGTGYLVTLKRGDRVVFQRRTRAARVGLPAGLALRPGRYRWIVWSLPRKPWHTPQARSAFVITGTTAGDTTSR